MKKLLPQDQRGIDALHSKDSAVSAGIVSCSGRGANWEVVHVVLSETKLCLECFMELELSVSSSSNVMLRSDMEGADVKEWLPIL